MITGIVKDVNGEPIIGASVKVQGTTVGTITDLDGKFSVKASSGAVLQVSYIGYVTEKIQVGNRTGLTITLKEDSHLPCYEYDVCTSRNGIRSNGDFNFRTAG